MFFLDDELCRRCVQDIRSITAGRADERPSGKRWVHDVEMRDGTKLVILDVTMQQISRLPAHTFAAQPGLLAWQPDSDGGDDFFSPIVGWAVTLDGSIMPIQAGGSVDDGHADAVIVAPDGRVWQNGFVQAADLEGYKNLIAEA